MSLTLAGARVVTSEGILEDAGVEVEDGKILSTARDSQSSTAVTDLGGGYLVPGFIDLHCHGAAGADFGTASHAQAQDALGFHLRHGTTGQLASLVAAPVAALTEQCRVLAELTGRDGTTLLGIHAEGPFLSSHRCGAQNRAHLVEPNLDTIRSIVTAAQGTLRMMTIAPELDGALDAIKELTSSGVLAAVGHTDATYAQAAAAFAAGAAVATHLFNGMRPIHHREPGPVLAALDAGVACEVINDGHHVHEAVLRMVASRSTEMLVLITDAISATGVGDGAYTLGGQDVTVSAGEARLTGTGSLAGSTVTMDAAVRRAVTVAGLPIHIAVRAASTNPARLLGLDAERGDIRAGLSADLVHLDEDLNVVAVMQAGRWVE